MGDEFDQLGRSCLTKDNAQDGVILFKDVCTQEWAMNTVERWLDNALPAPLSAGRKREAVEGRK